MKNKLTNLFYNEGLIIKNNKKNNSLKSLNKKEIIQDFKDKGIILFRNFNFKIDNILDFTNQFSFSYANDASRRLKRFNSNFVRNVDTGNQKIDLHSETSFSPAWPEIVWFVCIEPPIKSGKTTICDGINLWDSLSAKAKNFFISEPIIYNLKIPYIKKQKKKKKKWYLPVPGVKNCYLNFVDGCIDLEFSRYAVNETRIANKLAFTNHLFVTLRSEPQILKRTVSKNKPIPKNITKEIHEKAKLLTFKMNWKKNDLIMIDNRRFLHGREKINNNEKRDIINIQTQKINF